MRINKNINTVKSDAEKHTDFTLLFGKKNYHFMLIGVACIILGFFMMMGHDANTRPDGTYDPTYWNENIYSFTRIRLAPILIVLGFAIEVYAILIPNKDSK